MKIFPVQAKNSKVEKRKESIVYRKTEYWNRFSMNRNKRENEIKKQETKAFQEKECHIIF